MLLILPPSETKRDGGIEGSQLDLAQLSFDALTLQRSETLKALAALSRNQRIATGALSLGPTQRKELVRNRVVSSSPVLPAIERYTGVLYDGLDVAGLSESERDFAASHLVIHSALFGLLGANDRIPAYRLSHNSRLPGLSLGSHWRSAIAAQLAQHTGLIIDARSEAYAALGPAPQRSNSVYLRVVSTGEAGRRVALSHFNKKAKGQFARAMVAAGLVHSTVQSLLDWASAAGIELQPGANGELDLVV